MADINIERKQGPNVIPWIIGLLVLAVVAWFLLANRGDDRRDVQGGTVVDTVTAPGAGMTAPAPGDTVGGAWGDPGPAGTTDTMMMGTGMTDTMGVGTPP
jgi:hypothetical protein